MTNTRMNESAINASLDAYLHGAQTGDALQARKLHELLDSMLTERESEGGQFWLTDHGRMVLADMHRQLSHCAGNGDKLRDTVLEAVQYKPQAGRWNDTCDYLHDLRIALTVANELCAQRGAGKEPDVSLAARLVADSGEFGLDAQQINAVYDKIASTVHGFREIPGC
jgi:hypothetical protein